MFLRLLQHKYQRTLQLNNSITFSYPNSPFKHVIAHCTIAPYMSLIFMYVSYTASTAWKPSTPTKCTPLYFHTKTTTNCLTFLAALSVSPVTSFCVILNRVVFCCEKSVSFQWFCRVYFVCIIEKEQYYCVATMAMLEGTLSKWTNVMKGWQYRWFVLDEYAGLLSYYTVCTICSLIIACYRPFLPVVLLICEYYR